MKYESYLCFNIDYNTGFWTYSSGKTQRAAAVIVVLRVVISIHCLYLFKAHLTTSSAARTASTHCRLLGWLGNEGLERIEKEARVSYMCDYYRILLVELRQIIEYFSHDNVYPGRYLNPGPSEYKADYQVWEHFFYKQGKRHLSIFTIKPMVYYLILCTRNTYI
jgi:hypothetical protein